MILELRETNANVNIDLHLENYFAQRAYLLLCFKMGQEDLTMTKPLIATKSMKMTRILAAGKFQDAPKCRTTLTRELDGYSVKSVIPTTNNHLTLFLLVRHLLTYSLDIR